MSFLSEIEKYLDPDTVINRLNSADTKGVLEI